MLSAAELRVYLPLRGFADSLNLSVAAALVIHELFHLCPEAVGRGGGLISSHNSSHLISSHSLSPSFQLNS